jgi:hypothetical protein
VLGSSGGGGGNGNGNDDALGEDAYSRYRHMRSGAYHEMVQSNPSSNMARGGK